MANVKSYDVIFAGKVLYNGSIRSSRLFYDAVSLTMDRVLKEVSDKFGKEAARNFACSLPYNLSFHF